MACSLQQLLTRLTGSFLWERGSIQNRVRGELPWKLGPFLPRGYDFPRWVPDRIYLEDDDCWDRNSCNLQSGSPEGDRGEGGVSGQRHQLAGAGLHGDKQRPNPALLCNQWWEPKVVSSNYYARVHSNRPPLCRSLQERSSLALRQHQANQEERQFGGKLSCIEARAEIILSLSKKKKVYLDVCSPEEEKNLLAAEEQGTGHLPPLHLHQNRGFSSCNQLHPQAARAAEAWLQPPWGSWVEEED